MATPGDAALRPLPRPRLRTHVELAEGARFSGWEIVALGLPASGRPFDAGHARTGFCLERAGRPVWIERASYVGGSEALLAAFALAAQRWGAAVGPALETWLFAWCESQVAAAVKLVPLGQTAGQRVLGALLERIPGAVRAALALEDDEIGAAEPGLGILSAWHETQYTRLFRS